MKIIKEPSEIPDPRREQARQYELKYVLLFTIFALMSNAKGYRDIHRFNDSPRRKQRGILKIYSYFASRGGEFDPQ